MNISKLLTYAVLLFSLSFFMVSCGGNTSSGDKMEEVDKSGPEYTSAYVCPMHCDGSGSDTAGQCPVCGMEYVKNENHADHGNHEGHDH